MTSLTAGTRRWAQALYWLTWVAMAAAVAFYLYLTLVPDTLVGQSHDLLGKAKPTWPTSALTQVLLTLGIWLELATILYAQWHMAGLFRSYARDQALSPKAAICIRGIGLATLARALLSLLTTPYLSLVLSIDAPQGQRSFAVALNTETIALALAGGMMLLIGTVMAQAVTIARENEGFV